MIFASRNQLYQKLVKFSPSNFVRCLLRLGFLAINQHLRLLMCTKKSEPISSREGKRNKEEEDQEDNPTFDKEKTQLAKLSQEPREELHILILFSKKILIFKICAPFFIQIREFLFPILKYLCLTCILWSCILSNSKTLVHRLTLRA